MVCVCIVSSSTSSFLDSCSAKISLTIAGFRAFKSSSLSSDIAFKSSGLINLLLPSNTVSSVTLIFSVLPLAYSTTATLALLSTERTRADRFDPRCVTKVPNPSSANLLSFFSSNLLRISSRSSVLCSSGASEISPSSVGCPGWSNLATPPVAAVTVPPPIAPRRPPLTILSQSFSFHSSPVWYLTVAICTTSCSASVIPSPPAPCARNTMPSGNDLNNLPTSC